MGKSHISVMLTADDPNLKFGVWLHDSYASILSVMLGIELLTDPALDDWAALAGRNCLLTAITYGAGCISPALYEHSHLPERLRAIHHALKRVLLKLDAYGDEFPGRYWFEHNMLGPGEPIPPDLPIDDLRQAVKKLVADTEQLMAGE